MDQKWAVDEAFHMSMKTTQLTSTAHPNSPAPQFAHVVPTPSNPVLMEIDATWKAKALPNACCHCGVAGHWVKDCPLCFDVCHIDMNELQTLLEDCLATKDAVPVEWTPEADEEHIVTLEDFLSSHR